MKQKGSQVSVTFRQIVFITICAGVLGLTVNTLRPFGLLLVGDWSPEARLTTDSGESLVIPLDEAQKFFSSGKAVFLDARGPRDYQEGHILGAKNLPWQAFDEHADRVLQDIPSDAVIIAYCDGESCSLSEELTKALVELGYNRARVLVNGWTRWVQAGLPTAKGASKGS